MDWKLLQQGSAFTSFQIIAIQDAVRHQLGKGNQLSKMAKRLSVGLGYGLGKGHWQVFLIKGDIGKQLVSSGNHYAIYQRIDGLKAYIWLNRLDKSQLQSI